MHARHMNRGSAVIGMVLSACVFLVPASRALEQGIEIRIPASDNACISFDPDVSSQNLSEAEELIVCDSSSASNRDRTSYLRFDVTKASGARKVYSAKLEVYVTRTEYPVHVNVLNDGYTSSTRKGETEWTKTLYGTNAPYHTATTLLGTYSFGGGFQSKSLDTTKMQSYLSDDTNNELTFVLRSAQYNNYAHGVNFASLDNTKGYAVPTLVLNVPPQATVLLIK